MHTLQKRFCKNESIKIPKTNKNFQTITPKLCSKLALISVHKL
jgi:hypothetical protein